MESLVAIAASIALLAVALPWLIGPRSSVGGGGNVATPSAPPSPSPSPTPTPVSLAHAKNWDITFDYPTAWTLVDNGTSASISASISQARDLVAMGFVGSGSAQQTCTPGTAASPAKCVTTWSLPAGTIVLRFALSSMLAVGTTGPSYIWTGHQALNGPDIPGAEAMIIDGYPARFAKNTSDVIPYSTETVPGATEVLWWGLTKPYEDLFGYSVAAAIKGPNTTELEAEARALVASIRYVNKPPSLPTDPTALAQARQQALLTYLADMTKTGDDEHKHAYDCFPRTIGVSQPANIIEPPNQAPMTKPLAVTCTTVSMDPNAMQGWWVVLKETWVAGPDYPAGELNIRCNTMADGTAGGCSFDSPGGKDSIGFPHVGKSKYPG